MSTKPGEDLRCLLAAYTMLTPAETAEGYALISNVNPPSLARPGSYEFLDLPLLRSVDPRQLEFLDRLVQVATNQAWKQVRAQVQEQQAARETLYRHVRELDAHVQNDPEPFVFPDPYSLLFWIWTFHLFPLYTQAPGGDWKKYFYRGETRDYGTSRFQPKLARSETPPEARSSDVPGRALALLRNARLPEAPSPLSPLLTRYLVDTMTCAQALAVAQHYGFPTPLLDVTANPEVAVWFATLGNNDGIGVLGYWELDARRAQDDRDVAIVAVPPVFSRVRLQSGYFICTNAAAAVPSIPLRPLFFRHHPEMEPIRPTWLMSVGPVVDGAVDTPPIHEDPLHLEDLFSREWPHLQAASFPPVPAMSKADIGEIVRLAVVDLFTGAGRQGITSDGRRFNELHHPLLYSINRYAPHHTYQYAAASLSVLSTGALAPIAQGLINVYRAIIAAAIAEEADLEPSRALEVTRGLPIEEVMRHAGRVVGKLDEYIMPWPLNSWYEG